MDMSGFSRIFSSTINVFILVSLFSPVVKSLPFLDEIKSKTFNNNLLESLHKQYKRPLGEFSEKFINLQKTNDFDLLEAEQTINLIYDRLRDLFILPFSHPLIQTTKNESENYRGDCLAPDKCFTKKKGTNLCTVCEEDMSTVNELISFFQEAENASELVEMGEKCKHVINEYLFNYAITYLIITKFPDFEYPSIIEVFPGLFLKKDEVANINNTIVEKHRHKRMTDTSESFLIQVKPSFDSKSCDPESIAYFAEDYGYNSNHWNWHIIHRSISRIDRRGELFWFMHHQMLARYDIERLSLGCNRVESTGPLNRRLKVGYFPNLNGNENGQEWASRPDDTYPTNIRSNGRVKHDVEELSLWHARLSKAAKDGFMLNRNDETIVLSDDTDVNRGEKRGIDIFTAAAEADPMVTPNHNFYGLLHNHGHRIISKLHDPESQDFSIGVMASAAVSARDPSFYQWHKYVEEVIQEYKITQPQYSQERLELANIFLVEVKIAVDSELHISENIDSKILDDAEMIDNQAELLTGCNTYGVDISRGIDFGLRDDQAIIDVIHLDHIPFFYNIYVLNNRSVSKSITVRIFLAPIFDSDGRRMQLHEQQHLFIILDKFRYTLSTGENVIHRLSAESSITSNCRTSRRNSERERFTGSGVFGGGHCGCGWPHHLLLPRGKPDGMMFQTFVLLTDGDEDYVQSESEVKEFCAQSGEKYPDWQPMGYPFDRPFHPEIYYVDQLADYLTNAYVSNVSIRFTGRNILTDEFTC